jgi:hypothetical protein
VTFQPIPFFSFGETNLQEKTYPKYDGDSNTDKDAYAGVNTTDILFYE